MVADIDESDEPDVVDELVVVVEVSDLAWESMVVEINDVAAESVVVEVNNEAAESASVDIELGVVNNRNEWST